MIDDVKKMNFERQINVKLIGPDVQKLRECLIIDLCLITVTSSFI